MSVPEEERIRALLRELIEILRPLRFVVEPGKVLRYVRIVVFGTLVCDLRLLQADDGAANVQLRMIFEVELLGQRARGVDAINELFGSVEHTRGIRAFDDDRVAEALEDEGLFCAGPEFRHVFAE